MHIAATTLPDDDVIALKKIIQQQQDYIVKLEEYLRLSRHRHHGASSEKSPDQAELFNEAEAEAVTPGDADDTADVATGATSTTPRKARGTRKPLPVELPRIEFIHDLCEQDKTCACGCQKDLIGEDVSEQLDIVPARIQVIRHIRRTYACRGCESAPQTAMLPPQPIPKSNASPGLLAHIAVAKYQDALPLYRQEGILARSGIDLPRQTLARWMIQAAALLAPLLTRLREHLHAQSVLHYDETVIQVLKEPDKSAQSQSYMWVGAGGDPGQRVRLFDYARGRSKQVANALLEGYDGHLMTDGYAGYIDVQQRSGITALGCWAHVRRKFIEAQRAQPKKKAMVTGKAEMVLNYINKLYAIERDATLLTHEERGHLRQQRAAPILQELRTWLDKTIVHVLPGGKLGEALHYLDKQWPKLIVYVEAGHLPIDNNAAENAIRPFVIGRKNWLFADTPSGAGASAALYSVIETAKANDIEPYTYLKTLFTKLPAATTPEQVDALLPWQVSLTDASI